MLTQKMKLKQSTLILAGVVALLLTGVPILISPVYAGQSTLSLDPASRVVNPGDVFGVKIKLNTGGDSINTVTANLNFDPQLLKVVSVDTSGTPFTIEFEKSWDNTKGTFRSTRARPRPGVNADDVFVEQINFEALSPGTAIIGFDESSATYRNNDLQDNLGITNGGSYIINSSGTTTPTPTTTLTLTPSPSLSPSPVTPTPTHASNPSNPVPTPKLPDSGISWPTTISALVGTIILLGGIRWLKFLL